MSDRDRDSVQKAARAEIRAVETILRQWDPIGVEPGTVAPADEYDSYAPPIVSMVKRGCTVAELAVHLEQLGSEAMGLGPSSDLSRADSLKVAAEILGNLRPSNNAFQRTLEDSRR